MFALACFIGIYSYGIFFLGILGILTRLNIFAFSVSWFFIAVGYLFSTKLEIRSIRLIRLIRLIKVIRNLSKFEFVLFAVLIVQLLVNLIGALGPELGFDALWYHLSQPKFWLQEGIIRFIPGQTYRYSVTPQLTETLYTTALAFGSEIWAKLIHFTFGVLSLIVTYKISKKLLPPAYCLLPLLILSGNLVFSWEQTTAYIDLARTFFESLALLLFLERKYPQSAIILGLAVCSKLIAIVSVPIYILLLIFRRENFKTCLLFTVYLLLVPLPWLLFAYFQTGNPVYPVFSLDLSTPLSWNPKDVWDLFTKAADSVSPVYLITAPLIFFSHFKKWGRGVVEIFIYTLLAVLFWLMAPHTGGSRFFLPYLPVLSVLIVFVISGLKDLFIKKSLVILTLTLTLASIFYRLAANSKYLPVILGSQTKSDFLSRHLNYSFGDFYDTDNYLKNYLPPEAKIFTSGINNLFYLNYQLILPPQLPDIADYLLVRYTDTDFSPNTDWQLIHTNYRTKTHLFRKI
jgi:hypothetical protein